MKLLYDCINSLYQLFLIFKYIKLSIFYNIYHSYSLNHNGLSFIYTNNTWKYDKRLKYLEYRKDE